ncbi:GDP-mannose 4,6-dehydratase [Candidatus Pelagibacter sp. HIMB1782]|uniref:GDP-mannose 4,6-dehydratase n=1 Tax=Candidatus Pelagibacter sp. HIMB1782 TaxID=3413375 RepID=UPI003F82C257
MKRKKALITGITGQDGSYLSELLLSKNYKVLGMMRRSSSFNTSRIDHLYKKFKNNFDTEYGDLMDDSSIHSIISKFKPDEIYNLGAQSHVGISFKTAKSTLTYNTLSTFNILETIRITNKKIRFYQASSSEMFGITKPPQRENSQFLPQSPYGISKVGAYHTTRYFRNAYKLHACNGILFNHESPRRGLNFVTRKITFNIPLILKGEIKKLKMGNLDIKRDWGFAGDYADAIWKIVQYKKADDWVVATGENYSIKEFLDECFGLVGLNWKKFIIQDSKQYLRPSEVPNLKGDASKVKKILKWKPKVKFKSLCKMMLESDLASNGLDFNEAKKLASKLK